MNQARKPNRPSVDTAEVEALRSAVGESAFFFIDHNLPKGKAWTPSPEDYRPLRKDAALAIPDFIPERLDAPQNAEQAQISRMVAQDRGQDMPQETPQEMPQGNTKPQHASQLPPDFDPEVDDVEDVFVGASALAESTKPVFQDNKGNNVDMKTAPLNLRKPTQQQKPQPQAKSTTPDIPEHPVLQRLRERFGLKSKPVKSKKIGGIEFTFRKYSNQAYIKFVVNEVLPTFESDLESQEKIGYAVASIAIAAIDGVPVHKVFGIDIDPILESPQVEDTPMHPPTTVVVKSAEALYTWLLSLGIPELGDTLVSTYSKLFPEEKLVADPGMHRYVCPKKKCTEEHDYPARYNADGAMLPYYCHKHGVPMKLIGRTEDLANIPLA